MEKHTKTINGYLCEVAIDDLGTQGWITKGSCSGSMAMALDNSCITSYDGGKEYEITDSILHRIEDWAYSVGY
tara:strand:+ start:592 stop:810 length:219 start_codon:yes stop_codon:yes gene_type:complete